MLKVRLSVLALAGLFVGSSAHAVTITEDFSSNPFQHGWQVFGNTNLFRWDSTNHQLAVTWDSTQPNSYFYYPLGVSFTRVDDLSLEFDLRLTDIAAGVEPGKTTPMQLGFGFLNQAGATSTNFMRGAWGSAPNVAEFLYYAPGTYTWDGATYPSPATTMPSFISAIDSYAYAPAALSVYDNELPTNQTVHIRLRYSGADQTARLDVTTNGVALTALPPLPLDAAHGFKDTDNVSVDMFSISSYSSVGDDYDSILAHGTVANLTVTTAYRPLSQVSGGFNPGGGWDVQCFTHSNRVYTLERSSDLQSWKPAADAVPGNDACLHLQDTNPPAAQGLYRVRVTQP
jgi:hypothetical protein